MKIQRVNSPFLEKGDVNVKLCNRVERAERPRIMLVYETPFKHTVEDAVEWFVKLLATTLNENEILLLTDIGDETRPENVFYVKGTKEALMEVFNKNNICDIGTGLNVCNTRIVVSAVFDPYLLRVAVNKEDADFIPTIEEILDKVF